MICPSCSRELPAGFPGAVVACACGAATKLAEAVVLDVPAKGAGPYRAAALDPSAVEREIACPYCGNQCSALVRVCPHCDVRFDNIRCVRCYTLQAPGSFACRRCGQALELEPLLDVTDAPCPRCLVTSPDAGAASGIALEAAGGKSAWEDARIHECARCGGLFVPREALAEVLCRAEVEGPFQSPQRGAIKPLEAIRYLACPVCHASMNRVNFGKVSGVIVDVCRTHGTWFDAGELTRVVAFAAAGGRAKTRAREEADRKAATLSAHLQHHLTALATEDRRGEERLRQWESFLRELLFW